MGKNKKVIILGAGFSSAAGIPRQNQLLKHVFNVNEEDEFLTFEAGSIFTHKATLKNFLKSLYGEKDYTEIPLEDLYTIIDTAILKQRNLGIFSPSALFHIRDALDNSILYVINKEISEENVKIFSKKIKRLIGTNEVSFISLNWDFLLEQILEKLGYNIDYSIQLKSIPKDRQSNKEIRVLKPHGSLTWSLCPICETIYTEDYNTCSTCNTLYQKNDSIIKYMRSNNININNQLQPLLISPTFLKNNYIPQLNIIFSNIYTELISANELLFIGYSLPISDHDIRNFLIKAYAANPNINVRVINKENTRERKKEIREHYMTIYNNMENNFLWNGF